MSNLKNYSIRQPKDLNLYFLPQEKVLVAEKKNTRFFYPLGTNTLGYNSQERKVWLIQSNERPKAYVGLSNLLLAQAFLGVLLSYRRQLNIVGIGYQAQVEKNNNSTALVLKLGFSHLVRIQVPSFLEVACPKPRVIVIKGMNLQRVTNFAQSIKQCRLPSAYKEKGIYFSGEKLRLKQGKKT